ncbi:MAG: putative glycoside hydrolase [Candidatus Uhrbacteria bacterium]|nr:putative glycoside hydrolase [Candidatus Uhrbacteria bacterium]
MEQPRSRREIVRIAMPIGLLVAVIGLGGYGIYAQTSRLFAIDAQQEAADARQEDVEDLEVLDDLDDLEDRKSLKPPEPLNPPKPLSVALPKEVRGIYWTADSVRGTRGDELLAYMLRYGLNAAVIDIKMDNGQVALPATSTLERLGQNGIYRIARIAIMRDSVFAAAHPEVAVQRAGGGLWRDKTNAAWLDPAAPEVAAYAIALGREALAAGFDELQYDYVRFPSDGALSAIRYPLSQNADKPVVMRAFFDALNVLREEGAVVSYDVFGMTFWSSSHFGIGQRLEDVYPNADFISPMVYPSHYPTGFRGFENPALYPYEIVKQSLDKGAEMLEADHFISPTSSRPKFRPWLQDFDIGAVYTAARIEAQIKAARDAGASGWMLWNARNVYEPATYAE